jgi:hypothetical protein
VTKGIILLIPPLLQNAIERERKRQTGWRKHWARAEKACALPPRVRVAGAWLLMCGIFVALAMIAVIYSVVFGAETTRLMLFSWCIAQSQAFAVEVRADPRPRAGCCARCPSRGLPSSHFPLPPRWLGAHRDCDRDPDAVAYRPAD